MPKMVYMINREKLNEKTQEIYNVFDAYNMAATLMETKPIELRLMEMTDSQNILGKTFKINVHKDGKVSIIINQKAEYEKIMETEQKIKDLVDPFYTIEIDGRGNPVIAKFRIDLPNIENGKAFVGKMMDIIEMK